MTTREWKIEAYKAAADIIQFALADGHYYSKDASDDENVLYQNLLDEIAESLRRRGQSMEAGKRKKASRRRLVEGLLADDAKDAA